MHFQTGTAVPTTSREKELVKRMWQLMCEFLDNGKNVPKTGPAKIVGRPRVI